MKQSYLKLVKIFKYCVFGPHFQYCKRPLSRPIRGILTEKPINVLKYNWQVAAGRPRPAPIAVITMQQFLISAKRAKILEDPSLVSSICERLGCEISLRDGKELVISGDPYDEYNARNVMQAFARGFGIDTAYKLLSDDYFFKSIDLGSLFSKKERIQRIKARIIGREGRAKEYMQSISGAEMSVYGDTVSVIGTVDELKIISAALDILIEGGTHKKAYVVMEKTKRNLMGR